jgi:hypothetical protein
MFLQLFPLKAWAANEMIQYYLYDMPGQIAYDRSGNFMHAVSGASAWPNSDDDCEPTHHKGWFFNGLGSYMGLPPNTVRPNGILLPQAFSVEMWIY